MTTGVLIIMKEKFYRFMQGRYGTDEFSKFLVGVGMVLIILNILTRLSVFNLLFWVCFFYSYFRMFSKNYPARYAENQKFLGMRNRLKYKVEKLVCLASPYCKEITKRAEGIQNNLNNFDKDIQKEKDNSREL